MTQDPRAAYLDALAGLARQRKKLEGLCQRIWDAGNELQQPLSEIQQSGSLSPQTAEVRGFILPCASDVVVARATFVRCWEAAVAAWNALAEEQRLGLLHPASVLR